MNVVSRYFVEFLGWGIGPPEDNTNTEYEKTYTDNISGIANT
jgi:hypothetical protein